MITHFLLFLSWFLCSMMIWHKYGSAKMPKLNFFALSLLIFMDFLFLLVCTNTILPFFWVFFIFFLILVYRFTIDKQKKIHISNLADCSQNLMVLYFQINSMCDRIAVVIVAGCSLFSTRVLFVENFLFYFLFTVVMKLLFS
jgi:hypothetical protein